MSAAIAVSTNVLCATGVGTCSDGAKQLPAKREAGGYTPSHAETPVKRTCTKSILRRFMQLGVSARCTEFGEHFASASRFLGHTDTTEAMLRSVVRDLMLPNPLLWGDTTKLSPATQAKLQEEVGEITPIKNGWRGTHFTWPLQNASAKRVVHGRRGRGSNTSCAATVPPATSM